MKLERDRHPTGFFFIFWGELAERASFYGMKGLLVMYMISKLGYTDADSGMVASFFTAACYILPVLGGIIADRWLGKFKTIVYFAIPYIMGHIILGTFTTEVGLYVALLLLAGGSGSIKPNISTLMGQMYKKAGKEHLTSRAFTWFYMSINIGAAMTMWTLPFIRDHYGYRTAFMAPTILMAVSLGIFYLGKKYYPVENMAEARKEQKTRTRWERREDRAALRRLSGIFILIVFFWSVFDQSYSTWTFFARDYLNLETPFGHIPADAIQGFNPILVVILTPLAAWFWKRKDRDESQKMPAVKKMMIGFWLTTACMGVMSVAGYYAAAMGKISILWEVGAYIIMTAAELCISPIGLQLAYEEAPKHMKSLITGTFLFMVFIGDIIAGFFTRMYTTMPPGSYFLIMTVMIMVVTVLFYFAGKRFERQRR
ncbi:MAG: oligopeptide:H+ symporter [Parcubacteria group bacterium]